MLGTIKQVRQAQRLGLSLAEIAPLLRTHDDARWTAQDTVAFIEARLAIVRDKIVGLRDLETFITTKIDRYR